MPARTHPRNQPRRQKSMEVEATPAGETTYADFRQSQRRNSAAGHSGCANDSSAEQEPSRHRRAADVDSKEVAHMAKANKERFARHHEDAEDREEAGQNQSRLGRILELQRERGMIPTLKAECVPPLQQMCDGQKDTGCDNIKDSADEQATNQKSAKQLLCDEIVGEVTLIRASDETMPSKKVVLLGPDFSQAELCRAEPEPELQADCEEDLRPPPRKKPMSMASFGPPACIEESAEVVQDIRSRFECFRNEPDDTRPRKVCDNALFEQLQGKWRDLRGGMNASDLRPEFKALLAPLDVEVKFGFGGSVGTSSSRVPGSQPPNRSFQAGACSSNGEELPRLRQLAAADTRQSVSSQKGESMLALPSLKPNEKKVRPKLMTLDLLPNDRQRENCVHQ